MQFAFVRMKSFDQTLQSVWSARRAAGLKPRSSTQTGAAGCPEVVRAASVVKGSR